jgi:hypothetical protein
VTDTGRRGFEEHVHRERLQVERRGNGGEDIDTTSTTTVGEGQRRFKRMGRGDVMTKRLIIWVVSLVMFTLTATACGTLTGAAVGAGGGAAIGAGTGYGAGKGALIGTGVGAVAGAIYDIYKK